MRLFLFFLLFVSLNVKAQQGLYSMTVSPLVFTQSITCSMPYLTYIVESDYTLAPLSYSWTNGNASYTGTLVNIGSPGMYTITAYAGSNLVHTGTLPIFVNTVTPTSTVSPLSQTITCTSAGTLVMASTNVQEAIHFFVSPLGATMTAHGSPASYLPGAPGTYTYILMDSLNGCQSQQVFNVVTSSGFPTFNLSSAENFTLGCGTKSVATVTITQANTTPPGGILSYTILPSFIPGNVTTYSFMSAGIYTAIVKDNATNCETKIPFSIIGNSFVPMPFGTNFWGTITCSEPGLLMHYYQTVTGNYTFGWGQPNLVMPLAVVHPYDTLTAFADPTPGSVGYWGPWAIVTNNDNECFAGISTWLDQDVLPPLVGMKTNYSSISCSHPVVTITSTCQSSYPVYPQGIVAPYFWEGPPPQITSTLSSGYLAHVAGVYTVHAKDYKSGCTNTATLFIQDTRIYPQVTAPLQPFELCNSLVTLFPVNSSTIPLLFSWNSGTNAIVSNPTPSVIVSSSAGIYTVNVTNPANNCSVSLQLTVTLCTGLEETSLPGSISVYPNPAQNYVYIEISKAQTIRITDGLSKFITEQKMEPGKTKIEFGNYPAGIYFMQVLENDRAVKTIKLVKEN